MKKSLYDWCLENNRQDVLDRWDYELNNCKPEDVGFKSNNKYYFKCNKNDNHHSELFQLNNTMRHIEKFSCRQCKMYSFGDWCKNNNREDLHTQCL